MNQKAFSIIGQLLIADGKDFIPSSRVPFGLMPRVHRSSCASLPASGTGKSVRHEIEIRFYS